MDEVTQETLRVLLPSKVAPAVEEIAKAKGTDPLEELPKFHASATYRALKNGKSKYWWFSPSELGAIYLREERSAEHDPTHRVWVAETVGQRMENGWERGRDDGTNWERGHPARGSTDGRREIRPMRA